MGLRDSESIGRIATDPTNSEPRVRGRHRATSPARRAIAASIAPRTPAGRGSWCSRRRTRRPARSTSRSTRPTRRSSSRRCGITGARTAAASTAASAPACSARRTAATRGRGSRTSCRRRATRPRTPALATYDQTQSGLTSHESLGRIGIAIAPTKLAGEANHRVYIVFGNQTGPDKGFYLSDDNGDSFYCPRPAPTPRPRPRAAAPTRPSGGFQWWFGRMFVDPEDPLHLFNSDVQPARFDSTAARPGRPTSAARSAAAACTPTSTGWTGTRRRWTATRRRRARVFLGNDAGTYRSRQRAASTARGSKPTSSRGTSPTAWPSRCRTNGA